MSSLETSRIVTAAVLFTVFAAGIATGQTQEGKVKKAGGDCEGTDVAVATELGHTILPDNGRIETNLWKFCDGEEAHERFISDENESDFKRLSLEPFIADRSLRLANSKNVGEAVSFYLFRSLEAPKWIFVSRNRNRTIILQGRSLVHLMLLEKIRNVSPRP